MGLAISPMEVLTSKRRRLVIPLEITFPQMDFQARCSFNEARFPPIRPPMPGVLMGSGGLLHDLQESLIFVCSVARLVSPSSLIPPVS